MSAELLTKIGNFKQPYETKVIITQSMTLYELWGVLGKNSTFKCSACQMIWVWTKIFSRKFITPHGTIIHAILEQIYMICGINFFKMISISYFHFISFHLLTYIPDYMAEFTQEQVNLAK